MSLTRREFLKRSAVAAAAASFGTLIARANASEKVKVGVIGTGAQGQNLLRQLVSMPEAEVVAVCDVYLPNRTRAQEITQFRAQGYHDYRQLLERQDIEAVVIATPLHLHAPMTLDALQAGKHVFCEKAIAYSIDEARQMAQTAQRTGKILQIGHQRHYNDTYNQAYWLIKEGALGSITHVRVLWHRNNSWRRPVPDPKFERLLNWRLYKDYSHGLLTELASHQLDVVNWFLGALPLSVVGFGGIDYWKDGREVYDNVELIFNYPNGVRVMYTSITSNAYDGYGEWFFGDKGTMVLTNETSGLLFRERNAEKLEWEEDANTVQVDGRRAVVIEPTPTRRAPQRGEQLGQQGQRNAYYAQLEHFLQCVRTGEQPKCTAADALPALTCILGAKTAIETGALYTFQPEEFRIT
ncbi:MAG: Gfo/Idh/MocA family oxidoreductase [bacterium]|nr:Gfo/Idh/MocA family oxidoreductase [bacterium]